MPFPTALTTDQKTQIRHEHYHSQQFVVPNPNLVMLACQVNQVTFGDSLAEIGYDDVTEGAYTNVKVGMLVLISRTNDKRKAFVRSYVRATPTDSTLYIGETSARVQDADYIWVIKDYPILPKLPRYDSETGITYINYDEVYRTQRPLIYNLRSAYVVITSGNADFALAPLGLATASGETIASWAWDSDSGTYQAGDSSSQNVTLRFATSGVYFPRVTVTDSNGVTNYLVIQCISVPATYASIVSSGFNGATITGTLQDGFTASLSAFDGIDDMLDLTRIVVFTVDFYGAVGSPTKTPVNSNIDFVGYLRNEATRTDATPDAFLVSETQYDAVGIAAVLGEQNITPWGIENIASPTKWGEVTNATNWRMLAFMAAELNTVSNVCAFSFGDVSDDYIFPDFATAKNSSFMDMFTAIAWQTLTVPAFAAAGEITVQYNARYQASDVRDELATIMDFTNTDWYTLDIARSPAKRVGRSLAGGAFYNTSDHTVQVIKAMSPAISADEAQGQADLNGIILLANSDLQGAQDTMGVRVANHIAASNPYPMLTITASGGLWFFTPTVHQWYTHTIAASESARGLTYTTSDRWLLEEVSYSHDNATGVRETTLRFGLETESTDAIVSTEIPIGTPAHNPQPPNPPYNTVLPDPTLTLPTVDPDPEDETPGSGNGTNTPPPATNAPDTQDEKQGQVLVVSDGAQVWFTRNFWRTGVPIWNNISPTSTQDIVSVELDYKSRRIYVLTNDGDNLSIVWTAPNFYNPVWSSISLTGLFVSLRVGATPGDVYVLSTEEDTVWEHTFEFTEDSGADPNTTYGDTWTVLNDRGEFSTGVGYISNNAGDLGNSYTVQIGYTFDPTNITNVVIGYVFAQGTPAGASPDTILDDNIPRVGTIAQKDASTGTSALTYTASGGGTVLSALNFRQVSSDGGGSAPSVAGSCVVERVVIQGTGANPFGGGSATSVTTRYSDDYAATFASSVVVGSPSPDGTGFDTQKVGDGVYATTDTQVRKASDGGAYSNLTAGAGFSLYVYGKNTDYFMAGYTTPQPGDVNLIDSQTGDITPYDGVNYALVASMSMPITSDSKRFVLGQFGGGGGTRKLCRTTNAGGSWSFVNVTSSSEDVCTRRNGDGTFVYVADGESVLGSKDGGATLISKVAPAGGINIVRAR